MSQNRDQENRGRSLVEVKDLEGDKSYSRSPAFGEIRSYAEMDVVVGETLRAYRERNKMLQSDIAGLMGLATPVYGRYERGEVRLNIGRAIHLCEILGIKPDELLYEAAPHLWGDTPESAHERHELEKIVNLLPDDVVRNLLSIVRSLKRQRRD